jgi:hypothetical protein
MPCIKVITRITRMIIIIIISNNNNNNNNNAAIPGDKGDQEGS